MKVRWHISVFVALAGVLVLFSCSLRPLGASFALNASAQQLRDVSELTYFAVAVSGGVSNTLTPGNVGNRSLECLSATGQVSFPYTLSQLTTGVSIAISGGEHRFTILGFKDVSGTPATVAQMFSGSPSLKGYIVAQTTVNTLNTSSVSLNSTYVSAVTTDQIAACPAPSGAFHSIYNVTNQITYLKRPTTAWDTYIASTGVQESLFVDAQGVAHIVSVGAAVQYGKNSSGTFENVSAVTGAAVGHAAVVKMSDGTVQVLAQRSGTPAEARLYTLGSGWTMGSDVVLNSSGGTYSDIQLRIGAQDTMLAMGVKGTVPVRVQVNIKHPTQAWGVPMDVNSAGVQACVVATTKVAGTVDSLGYAHILYSCQVTTAPDHFHLGYATNRSGAWLTYQLSTAQPLLDGLAIAVDSSDNLYGLYAFGGNASFMTAPAATASVSWGSTQTIYVTNEIGDAAIGFLNANSGAALLETVESGDRKLRSFTYSTGSWTSDSVLLASLPGIRLFPLIYVR